MVISIGYCFYFGQDYERVVKDGVLLISFGPIDPKKEKTQGAKVGTIAREEIERVGFKVEWDGTFASRLSISGFVWQRR